MGDADEARKAKSLNNIEHHLKELVKVIATLNQNFVDFAKKANEWEIITDSDFPPDPNQLALGEKDKENGCDHA